jgi:hypothetical protein
MRTTARAPGALAAPMAGVIALMALAALEFRGHPFHDPFHG